VTLTRRAALALPGAALLSRATAAQAAWRPDRAMRMVVGFAPGGSADLVARIVVQEIAGSLGQQVVVENRSGASGNLATQAVVGAPADGLTLGFAGLQLATNPAMIARLGYEPERDLQMVSQFNALPVLVFASARSGIRTVADLIARAKANPEGLTVASGGYGTSSHLGAEMLFRAVGARYSIVIYRGGGPAFQAVLSGDADVMFDIVAGYHAPAAAEGRIRLLAVLQDRREAALPETPAIGELGFGPEVQMRSWQGLYVRAGTPAPVLAALHGAVLSAVGAGATQRRFAEMGMAPVTSAAPEEFQRFYLAELRRWSGLIREAGITAQ
jgi:tripartite-type tricarboxylate transporter receptor subunit TctC